MFNLNSLQVIQRSNAWKGFLYLLVKCDANSNEFTHLFAFINPCRRYSPQFVSTVNRVGTFTFIHVDRRQGLGSFPLSRPASYSVSLTGGRKGL